MRTSVTVRSTGSSAGPCAVVRRARAGRAPCKNAEEENSVAEVYLQLGPDTVATRAVLHLLEQARRLGVDCKPPPPPRAPAGCGIGCWNTPWRATLSPPAPAQRMEAPAAPAREPCRANREHVPHAFRMRPGKPGINWPGFTTGCAGASAGVESRGWRHQGLPGFPGCADAAARAGAGGGRARIRHAAHQGAAGLQRARGRAADARHARLRRQRGVGCAARAARSCLAAGQRCWRARGAPAACPRSGGRGLRLSLPVPGARFTRDRLCCACVTLSTWSGGCASN